MSDNWIEVYIGGTPVPEEVGTEIFNAVNDEIILDLYEQFCEWFKWLELEIKLREINVSDSKEDTP